MCSLWLGWPAHIFYAISCDEFLDNPCPMKCALSSWKMYISCWKVTGNDRSEISVQNLNAFLSTFDKVTTSLKKTDIPIPSYCICTYFVLEPSLVISFACFSPDIITFIFPQHISGNHFTPLKNNSREFTNFSPNTTIAAFLSPTSLKVGILIWVGLSID